MSDLARPYHLWASGFTRRWHQNAVMSQFEDFTCAHQGRCAVLVLALFPDHSPELLRAAVTHDAAEFVVGDLAAPFKDVGRPVAEAHAALEGDVLGLMGLAVCLSAEDVARLKLVDRLDAFLFVLLRAPHEALRPDWIEARERLFERAERLGVGAVVRGMVWDADAGRHEGCL